jgi:predicted permease
MREGYRGEMAPFAPEVWVPWNAPGFASASDGQGGQTGPMIGRLGAGVSLRQAQAEFSVLAASLPSDGAPPARVTVYPAFRLVPELASSVGLFAGFLLALVALALAITCVNLANLLLARWAARRHEIAVRLALGASRRRIVRQLLAETLLLAAAGSALGWALASAAARLLARQTLSTPVGPAGLDVAFDWRVFVFATAAMAGTTLAFGLLPALQSSSVPIRGGLTPGERAGGPLRTRMRMLLVSGQVALCATLLIVAALLLRGLQAATEIDRGFEAGHVLTASVDLTVRAYSSENGIAFYSQLSDRLEQLPGVTAVNLVDIVPLTLSNQTRFLVREGDALPQDGTPPPVVHTNAISPGHFRALAIPRLAGRDFDRTDTPQSTPVAIVNETLARLLWPGQQAVGRRVQFAGARTALAPAIEIVGVVRDSKYVTVGENPRPFLYRPLAQSYTPRVTLLVKTAGDPMSLLPVIRTELRRLDPDLPLYNAAPLDIATAVSLLPVRIASILATAVSVVAFVLSATGIYGVVAYLIRQRRREIGIRLALGATRRDIARLVGRQGLRWAGAGLVVGLSMAIGVAQLLRTVLYGVGPGDAVAFAGVSSLLMATAYAACWIPARRSSRMNPLTCLREE